METVFIMVDEGDDVKIYEAYEYQKNAYYEFIQSYKSEITFNDNENTFSLMNFNEKYPSFCIIYQNNKYSYLSNDLKTLEHYSGFIRRCCYEKK